MAEAPASDEDSEFTKYLEFLMEHAPHWTVEPEWIEWCDQKNPQKSIDEDTLRKIEHGNNFIEELKAKYDGPELKWALIALAPWFLVEKRILRVGSFTNKA